MEIFFKDYFLGNDAKLFYIVCACILLMIIACVVLACIEIKKND